MGVLADRTKTRWGKFRPWILFTAVPWCVVMVLAYTTPKGWSMGAMIAYAAITNMMLMTIYSMNNMPYAALGGVMTGDVNERAKLNSFRFIAVNAAQFIVGGFTLPLVAKFAARRARCTDKQYGWQMTMTIWAVLCLVLFLITFATTRERISRTSSEKSSPKQDFADLLKNSPWKVMFCMTLVHFAHSLVSRRRALQLLPSLCGQGRDVRLAAKIRLTAPCSRRRPGTGGILEWLGYIVHGDGPTWRLQRRRRLQQHHQHARHRDHHHRHLCLRSLAEQFGKKAVAAAGFALATVGTLAFYFLVRPMSAA